MVLLGRGGEGAFRGAFLEPACSQLLYFAKRRPGT